MPEENQNIQTSSSLRAETDTFQMMKEMLKKKINQKFSQEREQENQILYEKSLTSTDHGTCWQYDRACKVWEMARWIRKYWESRWYDRSNIEDLDLVQQYSDAVPDSWKIMYDYITQPQEDDPMPYYIKLWFEEETDEDRANSWFKNMRWSFDKMWQGLRTQWNVANMYDWKWDTWAIQDYAYDKYGRKHPFSAITDEEWKAVERDIRLDPSILDKYKSEAWAIKDTVMWGIVSFMNTTPLGLTTNVTTTWIASTEPWEWAFWKLWQWAETIWYYANKFPWLKQYRDALPTEEDKRERDQFVWQEIIALITRWAIKWYKEIKSMSNDWTWWGGMFERFKEQKQAKLNEKLQDTGGKITWAKTVQEQETATRWLQDADIKWSKNYEMLTEKLQERGKEIEAAEDIEYAKNEQKYKPEETRSMKDFEKDWYKSSVLLRPVEDWIELLKDFYEWNPEKLAELDLIEQKFKNEWLTKWEINNISRAISQEYETYKSRWQQKTSIAAKNVEEIRRAVKDFAREWNDTLVELDKKWSDNMNTRAMVSDLQDAIVKFKMNKRAKNVFQKLAWVAANIFSFFWWREFLSKIFKNAVWEDTYTPILRESDLKSLTNKFTKLNEKINWAKNKAEVEKVVEDFNKEMDKEFWPLEWEIIEEAKSEWYKDSNSYLEDKVELKEDINP